MPWYTVLNFDVIDSVVLRYLKQKWHYQGKPIVPVLNKQGVFESRNALDMIQLWGIQAFPFTDNNGKELWEMHNKIDTKLIFPDINTMIKDEQYILFYGGTDTARIKKLEDSATSSALTNIVLHKISHENSRFWDRVESLLLFKMGHGNNKVDAALHEIQKLFGYKKEASWGMFCKGSEVLISCQDDSILKLLSHDVSKLNVDDNGKLKDLINGFTPLEPRCYHYAVPATAGEVPNTLTCIKCSRVMKKWVTFGCCHKDE